MNSYIILLLIIVAIGVYACWMLSTHESFGSKDDVTGMKQDAINALNTINAAVQNLYNTYPKKVEGSSNIEMFAKTFNNSIINTTAEINNATNGIAIADYLQQIFGKASEPDEDGWTMYSGGEAQKKISDNMRDISYMLESNRGGVKYKIATNTSQLQIIVDGVTLINNIREAISPNSNAGAGAALVAGYSQGSQQTDSGKRDDLTAIITSSSGSPSGSEALPAE
jgi:hypothetical protein